ncbi:2-oxoglutarate dehydrogenase E1 component [Chengkuizengella axinellae]|uniref:2-oxoglutarate dehydrogenase E1 component n=1 Tax=Chengkuizengella axinellae TaxID=3064388 RepID=A0ABT9J0K7_9BACL|nr:2-oxoglutarate dehydrogenase E1 component [Chengkuizengella sp. 2205SS18-9]MDP5275112.1 2-oxoglutarate dehydrogenase E1 component [Chengkuizengella sp. 2205SS18-9]
MKRPFINNKTPWHGLSGPNLGYVMDLYDQYLVDPDKIDPDTRAYFDRWGAPKVREKEAYTKSAPKQLESDHELQHVLSAIRFLYNIRSYGHLAADIYPLYDPEADEQLLDINYYGLSKQILEKIPASLILPNAPTWIMNAYEAIQHIKKVYTGTIAFEFHHVQDLDERNWLLQKVESGGLQQHLSDETKIDIFRRLAEVEGFEHFLHKIFVGQKRFSVEGLDSMIILLDEMISGSVQNGAETINIGMAHRGRLNVLAHVLGKPYEMIFAEFQHSPNREFVPSEGSIGINYGWMGDVKYHLGLYRKINDENTRQVRLTLANNPSHLEFVGAVVEGFTRAAQDKRKLVGSPKSDFNSALAILIHGDAAFPGQGVVAETLNLSQLEGYHTGGTIHIIANNAIGFTTEAYDSRSTKYSSDLAKGYEIPILHVNADDPEACFAAAKLACEYRAKFHKDILIDLIGYRRFGHNEMDEPMTTNPLMYNIIHNHPTVKELYQKNLQAEGKVSKEELDHIAEKVLDRLKEAYEKVSSNDEEVNNEAVLPEVIEKGLPEMDTAVPFVHLQQMNEQLLSWPSQFNIFRKLKKILDRRREAFDDQGKVDWGLAEALAFASIISDGTPIRMTGQDSERGTFAQRNIVLHDYMTGKSFCPFHQLGNASFAVHNSPLSEIAVLGFEYGYNVFAPETLVLWEAQYGDFANAAQVMFDQFISAGRAKWGQKSGLVILLPHGYEGQGPEHSSGRIERFLTLAAENNWTVANLTSAAQYFHILRRQAAILKREEVRPLVIMTPKSLLRNKLVASTGKELSEGQFNLIIEQKKFGTQIEKAERIVIGSGKIMIDLLEKSIEKADELEWLHIIRVEQIYPFPIQEIQNVVEQYSNVKEIIWVQEEPKNMGAWNFTEPRLNEIAPTGVEVFYIGRRRRSSPAEGDPNVHKKEQARIIQSVFTRVERGNEDGEYYHS